VYPGVPNLGPQVEGTDQARTNRDKLHARTRTPIDATAVLVLPLGLAKKVVAVLAWFRIDVPALS